MTDALELEIISQRRSPRSSSATAKLVAGRPDGMAAEGRRYRFRKAFWPAELQMDRGLLLRVGTSGPWHAVSQCEPIGKELRLTCAADLGTDPITAQVREDPGRSLVVLREALAQLPADRANRARLVLGEGKPRVAAARNAANVTTRFGALNPSQQQAVTRALASEITFIWGPPGTGKTDVITTVVEGCLRQGETVLFVAPTHVAVDQALERICDLVTNLPDFDRGLVRRVGVAQVQTLIDRYGAVIDPDRVIGRLAGPLDVRIGELTQLRNASSEALQLRETADDLKTRLAAAGSEAQANHLLRGQLVAQLNQIDGELARTGEDIATAMNRRFRNEGKLARLRAAQSTFLNQRVQVYRQFAATDAAVGVAQTTVARLASAAADAEARAGQTNAAMLRAAVQRTLAELEQASRERAELQQQVLRKCRLVAMTAQRSYQGRPPIEVPDVIVVDEAGMVDLPTAYHLASRAGKRVVFAGDFRQLPAVVTGDTDRAASAAERGLVRDWLARDAFRSSGVISPSGQVQADPRLVRLDVQYRMRPMICELVNAVAYPDAPLRTGRNDVSSTPRSPLLERPLVLIDTSDLLTARTGAYRNDVHAALVREYVRLLQHNGVLPARRSERADPATTMAVIAPYNRQVTLLNGHLNERFGEGLGNLADTVHRFQGSQRPVVIIDTVSGGRDLGVFFEGVGLNSTTCRLLNVALSRAQDHVVVVANLGHLLAKLQPASEVRIMLDQLVARAQRIPVDDLVPVRVAAELDLLSEEELARAAFFAADEFDVAIRWDLDRARRRVEIYCPFLQMRRVSLFRQILRGATRRGVGVTVFTRGADENPQHAPIIETLSADGVTVVSRDQMHEKLVVVDDILWQGSLNLFAESRATELMMRMESAFACEEVRRVVERARPLSPKKGVPDGAPAPQPRNRPSGPARIYLNVPYAEKDQAKRLGAAWDQAKRKWYVDGSKGTIDLFARWRDR